jgi:GlpG protein
MIGHLESESRARTFSDFLYVKGIKNQIEAEGDGRWGVWIHGEDELEEARELLNRYATNPNDPQVLAAARQAQELVAREQAESEASQKRYFDRERLFRMRGLFGLGPLTLVLISVSVLVYVVREFTSAGWITDYLFISYPNSVSRDLPEVREGQIWRLITPIFLHQRMPFHLHILFNMLWMKDLGTLIESRLGTRTLALLVLGIAAISNLAQYFASGPNFLGMSGVVYGLLGYIWMRGRFDPGSGLFLHQSTVTMMLVWLVFGFTNVLPMANTVHTVGLVVGVLWGIAAGRMRTH